jgi:hypothetical protein
LCCWARHRIRTSTTQSVLDAARNGQ